MNNDLTDCNHFRSMNYPSLPIMDSDTSNEAYSMIGLIVSQPIFFISSVSVINAASLG